MGMRAILRFESASAASGAELSIVISKPQPCPSTIEFTGADPLAFVVSSNLYRRQLTPSQKSMVAEEYATLRHGQKKGDAPGGASGGSRDDAAEKFGVGRSSIDRARVVKTKGTPELAAAVESGEDTLNAAAEIAKLS